MQVKVSWIEQFMNWYPRHTKLYRRKSKNEPSGMLALMKLEFDELKPFFMTMEKSIKAEQRALDSEDVVNLCQAVLNSTSLEQAKLMIKQAMDNYK